MILEKGTVHTAQLECLSTMYNLSAYVPTCVSAFSHRYLSHTSQIPHDYSKAHDMVTKCETSHPISSFKGCLEIEK